VQHANQLVAEHSQLAAHHAAQHNILPSMLPNAICCTTCFPTPDTVQHAAQITAQLDGQHNILPIMPPNTTYYQLPPNNHLSMRPNKICCPSCRPTKHAVKQNMLVFKHSMLHNMLLNVPPNFAAVGRYGESLVFLQILRH
jgi:hypothetical protein